MTMKLHFEVECLVCHLLRLELLLGGQSTCPPTPVNRLPQHNQICTSSWSLGLVGASGGVRQPGVDGAVRTTG